MKVRLYTGSSIMLVTMLLLSAFLAACGGGGGGGNDDDDDVVANDDDDSVSGEPPFEYSPGEPGRFTGLHVSVDVDGSEVVSPEVEVDLIPESEAGRRVQSQTAVPASLKVVALDGVTRIEPADFPEVPEHVIRQADEMARPVMQAVEDLQNRICTEETARISQPASVDECDGPTFGTSAEQMGTFDGWSCWLGYAAGFGSFGAGESYSWVTHMAPEGLYFSLQAAENIYFPPDFGNIGIKQIFGCVKSPDGDIITKSWLGSLSGIGFSINVGAYSVGLTFMTGGGGFERAIQYETGWGFSLPLFGLIGILGAGQVSVDTSSEITSGFLPVTGYDGPCLSRRGPVAKRVAQAASHGNPLTATAEGLNGIRNRNVGDFRDAASVGMAESLSPFFNTMGGGEGGLANYIPPATNADWYADWFGREGDGLCSNCPNTSIDALIKNANDGIADAGSDTDAIVAAMGGAADQLASSMPQMHLQADLQQSFHAGADLTFEVAADIASEVRGEVNPYKAQHIVTVETVIGEPADISVTAEEIADLLGVNAAALEGATVTVGSEPKVTTTELTISDGVANAFYTPSDNEPVLFVVGVDLSTAAGPIDAPGLDEFSPRPAMRLVRPLAGDPDELSVFAPSTIVSGGSITVNAMLLDANGAVVDEERTFTVLDGFGNEIGTARSESGVATYQFIPEPTKPEVDDFYYTELTFNDGTTADGIGLTGNGFSRDAEVRINGDSPEDLGLWYQYVDSHGIAIGEDTGALPGPGTYEIVVINPRGIESEPFEGTLE